MPAPRLAVISSRAQRWLFPDCGMGGNTMAKIFRLIPALIVVALACVLAAPASAAGGEEAQASLLGSVLEPILAVPAATLPGVLSTSATAGPAPTGSGTTTERSG